MLTGGFGLSKTHKQEMTQSAQESMVSAFTGAKLESGGFFV